MENCKNCRYPIAQYHTTSEWCHAEVYPDGSYRLVSRYCFGIKGRAEPIDHEDLPLDFDPSNTEA